VVDLRLAGARGLVREMAAAGSLPMLDLSGPCASIGFRLKPAAARGRVTVAEVALGHRAVLTGLRTVPL
jgi:hypothetical protein